MESSAERESHDRRKKCKKLNACSAGYNITILQGHLSERESYTVVLFSIGDLLKGMGMVIHSLGTLAHLFNSPPSLSSLKDSPQIFFSQVTVTVKV